MEENRSKHPNTNEPKMQEEFYKSKLVKLKDLAMEPIVEVDEIENDTFPHTMADATDEQPNIEVDVIKPQETQESTNFDSLQQIGKKWLID